MVLSTHSDPCTNSCLVLSLSLSLSSSCSLLTLVNKATALVMPLTLTGNLSTDLETLLFVSDTNMHSSVLVG